MPEVHFVREQVKVQVPVGTELRRVAQRLGIRLHSGLFRIVNCHGHGLCGECCVRVLEGGDSLSVPTDREGRFPRPRQRRQQQTHGIDVRAKERLACQARVTGDVAIWTRLREGDAPPARAT